MTVASTLKAKSQYHSLGGIVHKNIQSGLTMVELLVALALSSIIAVAAISALIVARKGFTAVDASSQLRDNGRFASDLIQRLAVQSGYQDVMFAGVTRGNEFAVAGATANPDPNITGVDNALVNPTPLAALLATQQPNITTDYVNRVTALAAVSGCPSATSSTDTACANGSDVLILRYQTSEGALGSGAADGSMINCAGKQETLVATSKADRMVSIFHVARSSEGEPSLMCSYRAATGWQTEPIVQGVESFQVLYGVDGFTTGANTLFTGPEDTVPDKYLRASEMVVGAANSTSTYSNWRRVRSIRVGLVMRGPANSAAVKAASLSRICPLGVDPDTPTDCVDKSGSETPSMVSEFPRNSFTLTDDGRLRQVVTFTVFMRNVQTQQ